jgi:hypothetical protein
MLAVQGRKKLNQGNKKNKQIFFPPIFPAKPGKITSRSGTDFQMPDHLHRQSRWIIFNSGANSRFSLDGAAATAYHPRPVFIHRKGGQAS